MRQAESGLRVVSAAADRRSTIRVRHGFLYLCAILDWTTRKVLAWRLSNTLTSDFCTAALKEAIARYTTYFGALANAQPQAA